MKKTVEFVFEMEEQLLAEYLKNAANFRKNLTLFEDAALTVDQMPHTVVYEEDNIRLLHYKNHKKKHYKPPLLIVFSLINRSYILDLKPGKSIIEKMTQAGLDVYMIDWGTPGIADQFLELDDYINRFMYKMVEVIKSYSGNEEVSMMGYCMGGTMATIYAAIYPESIKNLILMATPIDFSIKEGLLMFWVDRDYFNVDKLVKALRNIPPWFLQSAFTLLRPYQNTIGKYLKFFEEAENPHYVQDFLTLEYWLNDNIPLSGRVYKQFVEDFYFDNLLVHNRLHIGKEKVDLRRITCPVLTIVAQNDCLVPLKSSLPINHAVHSQDKEVLAFPSGHIGLSVSEKAMKDLWPKVTHWLTEHSVPLKKDKQFSSKPFKRKDKVKS